MRTIVSLPLWRVVLLVALALATVPLASGRAIVEVEPVEVEPVAARSDLEDRALYPVHDPFYKPPKGFESTEPGTVLRKRRVIGGFFGFIPSPIETWQLLYRTEAMDGSPIASVTTVFKPFKPKTDRFVSFQTAYDSSNTKCNPSYSYQLGAIPEELVSSAERLVLAAYLLSGYIVSSSDYEGPDAAFGAARLAGMGVLDSMRAVRNCAATLGIRTSNPAIVGVGYSGGAIATGWAASLQPKYAPELNIKGWAPGGTPANLTSVLQFVDETAFSGFVPVAINGLLKPSAYSARLQPVVDGVLTPRGREALDTANSVCVVPAVLAFFQQSIFSTEVQTLGPGLLDEPTIKELLQSLIMGVNQDETPTAPVYLFHGTYDEVIPYGPAEKLFHDWCANGASVHFTTFAAGGHGTTEPLGLPGSLKFVADAFDGKLAKGCSRDTVLDETLNPIGLAANLEPIITALIDLIGKLGRADSNVKNNPSVLNQPLKV